MFVKALDLFTSITGWIIGHGLINMLLAWDRLPPARQCARSTCLWVMLGVPLVGASQVTAQEVGRRLVDHMQTQERTEERHEKELKELRDQTAAIHLLARTNETNMSRFRDEFQKAVATEIKQRQMILKEVESLKATVTLAVGGAIVLGPMFLSIWQMLLGYVKRRVNGI